MREVSAVAYASLATGSGAALLSAVTLRAYMSAPYVEAEASFGYFFAFLLAALLGVVSLVIGLIAFRRERNRRMTATAGGLFGLLPVLLLVWLFGVQPELPEPVLDPRDEQILRELCLKVVAYPSEYSESTVAGCRKVLAR